MNKQVTFGHILTILSVIVIPLMVWGVNVERRFEHVLENTKEIEVLKDYSIKASEKTQLNHDEVMGQLHNIELQLKDKKDRE